MNGTDATRAIQAEWPSIVALLLRRCGDLQQAEDAVQDAAEAALERWPRDGIPDRPGAWLTTVATRRLVDRRRRESKRGDVEARGADLATPRSIGPDGAELLDAPAEDDDVLRLVLLCCHPALAEESQVALTLRAVAGLSTPEIARAYLVPELTMAQRLVRAKRKIAAAGIPFRLPHPDELDARLDAARTVVELVFNEGYCTTAGGDAVRVDLCDEAISIARLVLRLHPDTESAGLLALLVLLHGRVGARTSPDGDLVLLDDQDRDVWDRSLLSEGRNLLDAVTRTRREHDEPTPAGPFELKARIAAVHAFAPSADRTDWAAIVALYDRLVAVDPSPVIALNRVVAVARADGTDAGVRALRSIDGASLDRYHLRHATEGWLLAAAGDGAGAQAAYQRARDLTGNAAEARLLDQRMRDLEP